MDCCFCLSNKRAPTCSVSYLCSLLDSQIGQKKWWRVKRWKVLKLFCFLDFCLLQKHLFDEKLSPQPTEKCLCHLKHVFTDDVSTRSHSLLTSTIINYNLDKTITGWWKALSGFSQACNVLLWLFFLLHLHLLLSWIDYLGFYHGTAHYKYSAEYNAVHGEHLSFNI